MLPVIAVIVFFLKLIRASTESMKRLEELEHEGENIELIKENWEYWQDMSEKINDTQVPDKNVRDEMVKNETKWEEYFTNLAGVWMYHFWSKNKDNMMVIVPNEEIEERVQRRVKGKVSQQS